MPSTDNIALVEVPPANPRNNSTSWPAHASTGSRPLLIAVFVAMNCVARLNRFESLIPATTRSPAPSPLSVKLNTNATAFEGMCRGNHT